MLEAEAGVHNESQPGSYVFMDADYSCNLGKVEELAVAPPLSSLFDLTWIFLVPFLFK